MPYVSGLAGKRTPRVRLGGRSAHEARVRRLRRKVDDPFAVKGLETIYGAGYWLRVAGNK
jgi:DNA-binding response OmpR family regulator